MSIVLVRHGETALNAARVVQPPATPLSARGHEQARALARRLTALSAQGIVSSDLPRALQTAQAVARASGAPLRTSALLQERSFGVLRGQSYDALDRDPLQDESAAPQGESMASFRDRVALAFAQLVAWRAQMSGPLIVVTHGLTIREILSRHVHLPEGLALPERLANTSVTIIAGRSPWPVTLLNDATHLSAAIGDDAQAIAGV